MTALQLLAALATAGAVAAAVRLVVRPAAGLAERVRPYAVPAMVKLGIPVDRSAVELATGTRSATSDSTPWERIRLGLDRLLLQRGASEQALKRLTWSQRYEGGEADALVEHRGRQLLGGLAHAVGAAVVAQVVGMAPLGVMAIAVAGAVAGASRPVASVDKATTLRAAQMRAELPPVAMLLAIRLQASGSAITAISDTVGRSQGQLHGEMAQSLRRHRAGEPLHVALHDVGRSCPDVDVATFWRILATAVRDGVDAAPSLRRLADDTRHRTLLTQRASATRRRAALLLPTIGLLAPQMLLFIAAPLPSLLHGIS